MHGTDACDWMHGTDARCSCNPHGRGFAEPHMRADSHTTADRNLCTPIIELRGRMNRFNMGALLQQGVLQGVVYQELSMWEGRPRDCGI